MYISMLMTQSFIPLPLLSMSYIQAAFNGIQNALANLELVLNVGKNKYILFSEAMNSETAGTHSSTLNCDKIEQV